MRILGVSGSMREGSRSARALQSVLAAARTRGSEVQLLDLRVPGFPIYRPGGASVEDAERIDAATEVVKWADAFVLATPDYHGSMSGAMKNFLDHYWTEFAGKLFAYLCASHERGLTAMDQMRTAVRQCYGWSLPYGVAFNGDEDFDQDGTLTNPGVIRRLDMLARDVTVYGSLIKQQFRRDLDDTDVVDTFAARYRDKVSSEQ